MFHPNLISDWDGFFSEGDGPLSPMGLLGSTFWLVCSQ